MLLQNLFFPIVGRSGDRYLKQNKVKTWPELQLDGLSWILNKEVSILHFVFFFWRETTSWEISGKTYVLTKFFWFIKNNGGWLSKIILSTFLAGKDITKCLENSVWHYKTNRIRKYTLIEILWSNLTLEQNSSWIWLSAGTPMLVLSTLARIIDWILSVLLES